MTGYNIWIAARSDVGLLDDKRSNNYRGPSSSEHGCIERISWTYEEAKSSSRDIVSQLDLSQPDAINKSLILAFDEVANQNYSQRCHTFFTLPCQSILHDGFVCAACIWVAELKMLNASRKRSS